MLHDFIGNKSAKKRIELFINTAKTGRPMPNLLLGGKSGVGKTKMYKCLCEELGAINSCINASIINEPKDIINIIEKKINECPLYNNLYKIIIGIDEAHALKKKMVDFLLTAVSENELCIKTHNGIEKQKIYNSKTGENDFLSWIFITNRANELPLALRTRLIEVNFIDYSKEEKAEISKKVLDKTNIEIYNDAAMELAKRCWNARDVVQTTESLISYIMLSHDKKVDMELITEFFDVYGIDENGLGIAEKRYFNILKENNKPMSVQSIASIMGIDTKEVIKIEEKLISTGLIEIIPKGRVCTESKKDIFTI